MALLGGAVAWPLMARAQQPESMRQPGALAASSPVPSNLDIRNILRERVVVYRQNVGIIVGVIEPAGRRVVAHGSLDHNDERALDGDTVFEIGSITKVFTALLLSDMVQRAEVMLTDPVATYLPTAVKLPERDGRPITLVDLATHTSGLPRLPRNFAPRDHANPYADYSVELLYAFLSDHSLTRDVGSEYLYSNLGAGLLGHVLGRRAGTSYETVVSARIADPLGMSSTRITLSPDMRRRLAPGHNGKLSRVPNWDFAALPGAGALRSSANDLLNFLAANLDAARSPLGPAMSAMLSTRRPRGRGREIALGWHVDTIGDQEVVWHNGATAGYRSFIGFAPSLETGVILLSNTASTVSTDDIGFHLLAPSRPLSKLRLD
jgi:D-alanyl-D-alanine-carboxypeptidase/D-alanyl-D-alanine-endopeptidase